MGRRSLRMAAAAQNGDGMLKLLGYFFGIGSAFALIAAHYGRARLPGVLAAGEPSIGSSRSIPRKGLTDFSTS